MKERNEIIEVEIRKKKDCGKRLLACRGHMQEIMKKKNQDTRR